MKKIKAFTLAEVLITLAIIGVVAALTIPTVVTNYKAKALETQKKKAMSVLANGFRLLMANDDVTEIQNTKLANCEDNDCAANEIKRVFNVISDNLSGNTIFDGNYQFNTVSKPFWTDSSNSDLYTFVTSDGMIFNVILNRPLCRIGESCTPSLLLSVDINGIKNPNKGAEDLCKFEIDNHGTIFDRCADMADWGAPPPGPPSNCHWEPGLCWDNGNGQWACSSGHMVCD